MKNIMNKVGRKIGRTKFRVKQHAPQILVLTGIGCGIAGAVTACKATTKLSTIIENHKEQEHVAKNFVEIHGFTEEYTENDYKKDTAIIYKNTTIDVVKLYGPSVALGVLSIGCILSSHRIMTKRNLALTAAYATIESGYKKYRERVIERFGEATDRELITGSRKEEVEVKKTDKDGNEITVKETKTVVDEPIECSGYARFFQEFTFDGKGNTIKNHYWYPDNEKNLLFLKNVERFANDKLCANGIVFLNEVYEMLGLPRSQAGQVVGWVFDETNADIDNAISFGLYDDPEKLDHYLYTNEEAILLDFNVDGNVWEHMSKLGVNGIGTGNPASDVYDYHHIVK